MDEKCHFRNKDKEDITHLFKIALFVETFDQKSFQLVQPRILKHGICKLDRTFVE